MDKQAFFQQLGFSEYESKILASFVKLKSANPKQIHEDSFVPQNKIYQILKNFNNLGILAMIPGEVKRYKLINLQTFIDNKLKEKKNQIKQLKESSKILESAKEKEQEFVFSLIKGQKAIMNKLAEHNPKVKKEILGVQRNWKVWGEGLRAMQNTVKKGIKVRIIGTINAETQKRAVEWKNIGCQIRAYNNKFGEYPLRFTIFDNKEARITIGKPEIQNPEEYVTIWTTSKPLIAILRKQFIDMWKESKKF
jgi:sugar-specific transcriptional regulator TrmB